MNRNETSECLCCLRDFKIKSYALEKTSGYCDVCIDLKNRISKHQLKDDEIHKDLVITLTYKVRDVCHTCSDVDVDEHVEIQEFQVLKGLFKNEDLTMGKRVKDVYNKKMLLYTLWDRDCSHGYRCEGGLTYKILDAKISKVEADFFDE